MRKLMRGLLVVAALFSIVLVAVACGDDDEEGAREGSTIKVGAFDFSESHILAEIYAQALENDGFPVDKGNIQPGSPREIVKPALEAGEIEHGVVEPQLLGELRDPGPAAGRLASDQCRAELGVRNPAKPRV